MKCAKSYPGTRLNPAAIREQFVADYVEQFTKEEAADAIAHLNGRSSAGHELFQWPY